MTTEAGGTAGVLRRKIGAQRPEAPQPDTAVRALRLSLARASRDEVGLDLTVTRIDDQRRSLAELLDMQPDRAFLAMLEGPEAGLGVMALSPEVLAALIEVQTVGRLTGAAPALRRPTRTDAAMVAGTIDRTLRDLELALAESPDLSWTAGFQYASFLDDPRPLGLLLDDHPYRVLTARVTLADAEREGTVLLALPAAGKGPKPAARPAAAIPDAAASARAWTAALTAAVNTAEVQLDAVMARIRLPLADVMGLDAGALIPIGTASLDTVALEAAGGRRVAEARLGQNRGLRALRLSRIEDVAAVRGMAVSAHAATPEAPASHTVPLARSA